MLADVLPALPNYDATANSGWLGAHLLYTTLLPGLTADQIKAAGVVLDDLQTRQRLANANALASLGKFEVCGEVLVITPSEDSDLVAA